MLATLANPNFIGEAVATDSLGNIYTAGVFGGPYMAAAQGWGDFDPGGGQKWVNSAGDYDGFLAKYGPDRSLDWVVRLTGAQRQMLKDLAVDADGSVYVVGTTTGNATFESTDGSTQTFAPPQRATIVAKVSPDGVAQWVHALGYGADGSQSWGGSIALDGAGHVYVGGTFGGANADFDPGPDVRLPSAGEGYVVKLHTTDGLFDSGDGSPGWVAGIAGSVWLGSPSMDDGNRALAADATGVYAAGSFSGTIDFGNQVVLVDEGANWDGFLAKLDASGTAVWAKQYTDTLPQGVAIDATFVYAASGFVAKYTKDSGSEVWIKQWAGPGGIPGGEAQDLLVQGGKLYLTGGFGGTVDFDLNPATQFNLTSLDHYSDTFVWELTDAGDFVWAGQMAPGKGLGIAVDGSGNVVTTGYFHGTDDFDPGPATATLTSLGGNDAFVSRLKPSQSGPGLTYDTSFPAFQIGSYDRRIDDGDPGYVESGSGWKAASFGGYNGDARYHAKGKGANTATWRFDGMAASGAATYDVFVTFTAKSNNASNAKYNVNGTIVSVNQRVSPSGGWYKLGTFSADASGKITVVLSDNANGNVVADAAEVVINAPAAASASAAAAVAQRSNSAALMSATDFWMSDLGNQSTKRKQSSKTALDLLSAGFDPLV